MKNKIEISAAAGMVPSRGLRRRRVFGILSAMGLMSATALIGAERVSNSFVTVEGDGVRIADDGSIHFPNAKSSVAVEVTARPGWKVNGKKSLSLTRAPGDNRSLSVTSELGEDSDHVPLEDCQFDSVVSNAHIAPPAISIEASEGLIFMYAQPESNVLVSASASCETLSNGVHEVTTTWLPCPVCHAAHDPVEEKSLEESAPGEEIWTASGAGVETNSNAWTGYMTKGKGQQISFSVVATNECRKCICEASTNVVVDVHELSIDLPDEFLGLNMTDEWRGRYVTRSAIANIDPAPARAEYLWAKCGRCDILGAATNAIVTYGATNQTGPSDAYRAEELIVNGTAFNKDGMSTSATCTTNFTVVKVDIALSGVGEDGDETVLPAVEYVADDNGGGLSKTGLRSLYPVSVTCEPADVPGSVDLAVSSGARMFEITSFDGDTPVAAVPAQSSYLCSEIGQKKFGIHGHSVSVLDVGELMTAAHGLSGARDHARVKVVPPPPLEVSVQLDSPASGGAWPYDPVWDDPEWKPTVDGSFAELCAEDTDEALVIYTLSRDAKLVITDIYKSGLFPFPDDEVAWIPYCSATEGVHTNVWCMLPNLDEGEYYAKVTATEAETCELRFAESNNGEVIRDDYYTASGVSTVMTCQYIGPVQWEEHLLDNGERKVNVTIMALGPAIFANKIALMLGAGASISALVGAVIERGADWMISFMTDFASVPQWLQPGVSIFGCGWNVVHWEWDDDKYVKASRLVIPGPPHAPDPTIIKGEFEVGYLCYAQWIPGDKVVNGRYNPLNYGFYSDESSSSADANIGYRLEDKWGWERKPYGLKQPQIVLPQLNVEQQ